MKKITKLATCSLLTVLFFGSAGIRTASAQDRRVTCESEFGDYNYCRVDTDNNVRLVRRISSSSCTEGSSWGYDNRGIWVDRGCRAEFAYGKSGGGAATGAIVGGAILAAILASRHGKKNNNENSTSNDAYAFGYSNGRTDALANQASDPARYRGRYDARYESDYNRGYREGFQNGLDSSRGAGNGMNQVQQQYYNSGFQRGQQDSNSNRGSNYRRYRNDYDSRFEYYFKSGYEEGYQSYNGGNYDRDDYYNRDDSYNRVPNWLVGTYRAYTPGNNRTYTDMTFYADGRVWIRATNGTSNSAGSYSNRVVTFEWGSYRIARDGNGIRVTNLTNRGEASGYYERVN